MLNFSTANFDAFTAESIGISLCQKYQLSKGKSLIAYCQEASPEEILKLFTDLLEYYELNCMGLYGEEQFRRQYENCRKIIDRENGSKIQVETPAITCVNREYVKDIAMRANRDIDAGEYDSAITKARTLLEEVFCHAIEAGGQVSSDKGDIGRLYNQVKDIYDMHQSKDVDHRINALLYGLEKILTAIKEMRNGASDAHGVGVRRIAIEEHHARLFVNAALTMADFILSIEHKKYNNG